MFFLKKGQHLNFGFPWPLLLIFQSGTVKIQSKKDIFPLGSESKERLGEKKGNYYKAERKRENGKMRTNREETGKRKAEQKSLGAVKLWWGQFPLPSYSSLCLPSFFLLVLRSLFVFCPPFILPLYFFLGGRGRGEQEHFCPCSGFLLLSFSYQYFCPSFEQFSVELRVEVI